MNSARHILGIMSSGWAVQTEHIQAAIVNGPLANLQIGAIVSDNCAVDAPILKFATSEDIPYYQVTSPTSRIDEATLGIFRRHKVEIVLLTGYKRKVGPTLLKAFPYRILNYHPAPIPQFGGKGMGASIAQAAVLAAGVPYSGPVIHIVDEEYDHGPVLGYSPVKVRPEDTPQSLNVRCNESSHRLLVGVIYDLLDRLDHPDKY